MATNIQNKAIQVRLWINKVWEDDGEVGHIDIRAFIKRRWPDLSPEIQEAIFNAVTED